MPALLVTVLLALLAVPLGYLAAVQVRDHDLSRVFGAPPLAAGDLLYRFDPGQAARIYITNNAGERAVFEKNSGIWIMKEPHQDRADFSLLQTIAFSAASLRIENSLPEDAVPAEDLGLTAGSYTVEVIGGDGTRFAHFQVGRRSAWHRLDLENEQVFESVFIKPLDADEDHIYVCSGINSRVVLDQGFDKLRDHHPFLFSKAHLSDIEIRRNGGIVHLSRRTPQSPWRITKPLELRTDPETVAGLIDSLYQLKALKVSNPEAVTGAPDEASTAWLALTLREFDAQGTPGPASATLSVAAPAGDGATTALATVDNRARLAVFEMPLSSPDGLPALNQLPLEVNELRSKTLLARDFRACETIEIHGSNLKFPLFFKRDLDPRTGRYRWRHTRGNRLEPANERTMNKLRLALEEDRVLGFASDAADDLDQFGLTEPDKRLLLRFGPESEIDLRFGRTSQDKFYAMRAGSSTVAEIDAGTYLRIPATPYQWRNSFLWNLSIVDLEGFTIRRRGQLPLTLTYDDLVETWTARRDGEDVLPLLNLGRARKFIDFLETLEVERWLGPDQPEASRALDRPAYSLDVRSRKVNDEGEVVGVETRTLDIAPIAQSSANKFYYGRVSGDPDFFILDRTSVLRLATNLLETE